MSAWGKRLERRQHERHQKNMTVQVKHRTYDVSGALDHEMAGKNIGLGGICFLSPIAYKPETELDLLIRIREPEEHRNMYVAVSSIPYKATGKVVRCQKSDVGGFEVGVKFTEILEEDFRALKKYLIR